MGAAVGRYFHTLPGFSMDGGRGWREIRTFKGSDSHRESVIRFFRKAALAGEPRDMENRNR